MQKLLREAGVPAEEIDELISVSEGSVSVALDQRDPEQATRRRAFVTAIVRAAQRATPGTAAAFGEQVGPDRSVTRANVLALATHLARAAKETVEHDMDAAADLAAGHQLALELASDIETANASPSLSLTRLVLTLARSGALARSTSDKPTPRSHRLGRDAKISPAERGARPTPRAPRRGLVGREAWRRHLPRGRSGIASSTALLRGAPQARRGIVAAPYPRRCGREKEPIRSASRARWAPPLPRTRPARHHVALGGWRWREPERDLDLGARARIAASAASQLSRTTGGRADETRKNSTRPRAPLAAWTNVRPHERQSAPSSAQASRPREQAPVRRRASRCWKCLLDRASSPMS